MAKRKRQAAVVSEPTPEPVVIKKQKASEPTKTNGTTSTAVEHIQVVAGSYDGVLHGLTATIEAGKGKKSSTSVSFADSFLFHAHTKAIRCIAVSPPSEPTQKQSQKIYLASGCNSGRINSYVLSAYPPKAPVNDALVAMTPRPIIENKDNRELGTFDHHTSAVTALDFPTRSKLLSASDDSTIAVLRTRDWALLEPIKVPKPKPLGRPSGDTAPIGGTPSGVNDFAIHPSMRLMISVSKGERSMRLWNLVTGKKAGVLNFSRTMLSEVGEGKHATGEGRTVTWGVVDGEEQFAVGFERDIVVFGMDSVPKCKIMPATRTKIHRFRFISLDEESGLTLLAVSTEDGRIMFFSTKADDIAEAEEDKTLGTARLVASLGGKEGGVIGRIKDFTIVRSGEENKSIHVVGGSSDGKVRLWQIGVSELVTAAEGKTTVEGIGKLVGTYETGNRITCLTAFSMTPRPDGVEAEEDDFAGFDDEEDDDDSSDSDEEE